MSSILIGSLSCTRSNEIARRVSQTLGFRLLGPDLLAEAARRYGVSEPKLQEALGEPPSLFGMWKSTRTCCLAYFRATLAHELLLDRAVYLGPGGPLLIDGVPHLIRVRLVADLRARACLMAERREISTDEAERLLLAHDARQCKWARKVLEADESEPGRYDLLLDTGESGVDEAVRTICEAAGQKKFLAMSYSMKVLQELELAARVRAALVAFEPEVLVRAEGQAVFVKTRLAGRRVGAMKETLSHLEGLASFEVEVVRDVLDGLARTMR